MIIEQQLPEVRVRRYKGNPVCDVIVIYRGQKMSVRCQSYDEATKWARIECRAYRVADGFTVEQLG